MTAKSAAAGGGKVSFDLLAAESSGDEHSLSSFSPRDFSDLSIFDGLVNGVNFNGNGRPARRKKKHKKKRQETNGHKDDNGLGFASVIERRSLVEYVAYENLEFDGSQASSCVSSAELRQRNVSNGGSCDVPAEQGGGIRESSTLNTSMDSTASTAGLWRPEEMNGGVARLETMESLDWNKVIGQDPNLLRGLLHFNLIDCTIVL